MIKGHSMRNQITVLAIYDDEPFHLCLQTALELAGHDLITAADGRQGLELLAQKRPDIVLLDLQIPDMSGLEVIVELHTISSFTPVIVISGYDTRADAIKATRCGAWDYLTRPFNEEELAFAIGRCLERTRLIQENCYLHEQLEQLVHAQTSKIKESRARYRRLLESVTTYVYTVIVRNGVPAETIHRPGCERITGHTPEEFDADPGLWYRIIHEDDRPLVYAMAQQMLTKPDKHTLEHRIIHKDGTIHWVSNTLVPGPSWQILQFSNDVTPDSRCLYYDGIISDITRCKTAEERLKFHMDNMLLAAQRNEKNKFIKNP